MCTCTVSECGCTGWCRCLADCLGLAWPGAPLALENNTSTQTEKLPHTQTNAVKEEMNNQGILRYYQALIMLINLLICVILRVSRVFAGVLWFACERVCMLFVFRFCCIQAPPIPLHSTPLHYTTHTLTNTHTLVQHLIVYT